MSYKHLSIVEREKILFHLAQGKNRCQIAKILGRHKSTVSRELARNKGEYLPSKAQSSSQGQTAPPKRLRIESRQNPDKQRVEGASCRGE